MATYTANYGLHQWEPEDDFLRTDFNQIFSKIDAALGRAERCAQANAYNVYNLMLQNYYEGKYTGYKKAALFDGFLDGSGIAEKSDCLIRSKSQMVLTRQGQEDIYAGYASVKGSFSSSDAVRLCTVTAGGLFTGWTVKLLTTYLASSSTIHYTVAVNGAEQASGDWAPALTTDGAPCTLTLSQSIPVTIGDELRLTLRCNTSYVEMFKASDGSTVGGTLHFTPACGLEAALVSCGAPLPVRNRICVWVRHSGGTVGVTVVDGEEDYSMSPAGTAEAVALDGTPCTESAFVLENAPAGGTLALRVALTLEDSESSAVLFDYGAIFL